jgi:hypothetical protein
MWVYYGFIEKELFRCFFRFLGIFAVLVGFMGFLRIFVIYLIFLGIFWNLCI